MPGNLTSAAYKNEAFKGLSVGIQWCHNRFDVQSNITGVFPRSAIRFQYTSNPRDGLYWAGARVESDRKSGRTAAVSSLMENVWIWDFSTEADQ